MLQKPSVQGVVVVIAKPSDVESVLIGIVVGFCFEFAADLARLAQELAALNKMVHISPSN